MYTRRIHAVIFMGFKTILEISYIFSKDEDKSIRILVYGLFIIHIPYGHMVMEFTKI